MRSLQIGRDALIRSEYRLLRRWISATEMSGSIVKNLFLFRRHGVIGLTRPLFDAALELLSFVFLVPGCLLAFLLDAFPGPASIAGQIVVALTLAGDWAVVDWRLIANVLDVATNRGNSNFHLAVTLWAVIAIGNRPVCRRGFTALSACVIVDRHRSVAYLRPKDCSSLGGRIGLRDLRAAGLP